MRVRPRNREQVSYHLPAHLDDEAERGDRCRHQTENGRDTLRARVVVTEGNDDEYHVST